MHPKDALGRYGEELATQHLIAQGLTILDRNWRCEIGELDIVASLGSELVVCEVKTRRHTAFGTPLEAVGPRKVKRLRQLASRWLVAHQVHATDVRIDVIGIVQPSFGAPVIDHVRGVGV